MTFHEIDLGITPEAQRLIAAGFLDPNNLSGIIDYATMPPCARAIGLGLKSDQPVVEPPCPNPLSCRTDEANSLIDIGYLDPNDTRNAIAYEELPPHAREIAQAPKSENPTA